MRNAIWMSLLIIAAGLVVSCDEGIDDNPSSAKVSGYVYMSHSDPQGVRGVRIILESDVNSENPYLGPDRWFETDENGYFEGYMYLGQNVETDRYYYVADFLIQYFYDDQLVYTTGGITLSPGSSFTMPPTYLN
ncbi:MAG: hypothetical protein KDB65_00355 [Calditrichaeota bacterium]|nr:hypothetical protein [Calditrichota bacterium]MCB9368521.1 hypothetical protein [Calditrichota bacterium]